MPTNANTSRKTQNKHGRGNATESPQLKALKYLSLAFPLHGFHYLIFTRYLGTCSTNIVTVTVGRVWCFCEPINIKSFYVVLPVLNLFRNEKICVF